MAEAAEGDRLASLAAAGVDPVSGGVRRRRRHGLLVAVACRRVGGGGGGHLTRHRSCCFAHTPALVARPAAERRRRPTASRLGGLHPGAVQLPRTGRPCRHGRCVPDVLVLVVVAGCRTAGVELGHPAAGVVVVGGDGTAARRRLEGDVTRVHARHSQVVSRVGRIQRLPVTCLTSVVQRMPSQTAAPEHPAT